MSKILLGLIICIIILSILLIISGIVYIYYNKNNNIEKFIDPSEYYNLTKEFFDNEHKDGYSYEKFSNVIKSPKIDKKDINPTVYNMSKYKYINGEYDKDNVEKLVNKINGGY